jgi:hypothetical protein
MTEHDIGYLDQLRPQLVAAAARLHPPRRHHVRAPSPRLRPVMAAVAVAVLVLAAGLFVHLGTRRASAQVQVSRTKQFIAVRIVDAEARPDEVRRELAAAHLPVTVTAVPTGPPLVSRFLALGRSANSPDLEPVDSDGVSYPGFRIPADFTGKLDLYVGRPADKGEAYAVPVDAYAPGEPLSCLGIWGTPVAEAAPHIDKLGLQVRWQHRTGSGAFEDVDPAQVPTSFVTDALAVRDGALLIYVAPTPASLFLTPPSPGEGRCRAARGH